MKPEEALKILQELDLDSLGDIEEGILPEAAIEAIKVAINTLRITTSLPTIPPIYKLCGWAARDEKPSPTNLAFFSTKPERQNNLRNRDGWWASNGGFIAPWCLPNELFPDLKWEDEPIEVEITMRQK